MLRPLKELRGFEIEATDGVIGRVTAVYFDDDQWSIRYLVVNTRGWRAAHEVLISPTSLGVTDGRTRTIAARLTRQQVEDSPSIDLHRPVSRQHEVEVTDDGWPASSPNMGLWESRIPPIVKRDPIDPAPSHTNDDPHLRSNREVVGCRLRATEDTFGHVDDLIIDDATWTIRYLAADRSSWWFGGHVLIAPRWIRAVRWPEHAVDLTVDADIIAHSPTWNPSHPVTQADEDNVLDYYRRRQAWAVDPRSNDLPFEPHPRV